MKALFSCRAVPAAALIILGLASAPGAADEVCSRPVIVWDHKVKKAEREGLKVEARAEALADLGRQVWNVTLYMTRSERVSRVGERPAGGFSEDEVGWRIDRSLFEVNQDLHGGRYDFSGDKRFTEVRYCVDRSRFEQARRRIEQRRIERVASLRLRFAEIERAMAEGDVRRAGDLFPNLKSDVNLAIAEDESYRSVITGETRPFSWWISQWSSEVRSARTYSLYCAATAGELVEAGHLQQAEEHVKEALSADSRNVVALQVSRQISSLRVERRSLFDQAEAAAAGGRGTAARRYLRRAEQIDVDDRKSLERSGMRVDALLIQYMAFNPRWMLDLGISWGSMAVDEDATLEAITVTKTNSYGLEAQTPMMLDLELRARLGRWMQIWGSAGFGRSLMNRSSYSDWLLDFRSYQGGIGFRTARGKNKPTSFQVGGGLVHETVELNGFDGSAETRVSPFVRLAIEGRRTMLFAEYAFGFEDESLQTESPVAWSNGYQIGIKWSLK